MKGGGSLTGYICSMPTLRPRVGPSSAPGGSAAKSSRSRYQSASIFPASVRTYTFLSTMTGRRAASGSTKTATTTSDRPDSGTATSSGQKGGTSLPMQRSFSRSYCEGSTPDQPSRAQPLVLVDADEDEPSDVIRHRGDRFQDARTVPNLLLELVELALKAGVLRDEADDLCFIDGVGRHSHESHNFMLWPIARSGLGRGILGVLRLVLSPGPASELHAIIALLFT